MKRLAFGVVREKRIDMLNKCPICGREWIISMFDDFLLPACGCFGDNARDGIPNKPCQTCGLNHAYNCPKMKKENTNE